MKITKFRKSLLTVSVLLLVFGLGLFVGLVKESKPNISPKHTHMFTSEFHTDCPLCSSLLLNFVCENTTASVNSKVRANASKSTR